MCGYCLWEEKTSPPFPPYTPHQMKCILTYCPAHAKSWGCIVNVMQQFAPPLPMAMVRFHRLAFFWLWVLETAVMWVSESVMGFKIHNVVGNVAWGAKHINGGNGV